MGFFGNLFNKKSYLPVKSQGDVAGYYQIPEPTKSLLFITSEDVSKISSAHSIKMTITLTDDGIKTDINDGHDIFGEPSLIWTKLPVIKNNMVEEKPMYFPAYSSLSPEHRFQYLTWLRDVTKPTNLSYVFLYYYGLERRLLFGNFELAFNEIVRLLKYHNKGTFRSYAEKALIVSALHWKKYELIKESKFLYDGLTNEELLIRKYMDVELTPTDLMGLASHVGFKNKRYIKLYPIDFERELGKVLIVYECENGRILDSIIIDDLDKRPATAFANFSLKDKMRSVKVPSILENNKFQNICCSLLEMAHNNLKVLRNK